MGFHAFLPDLITFPELFISICNPQARHEIVCHLWVDPKGVVGTVSHVLYRTFWLSAMHKHSTARIWEIRRETWGAEKVFHLWLVVRWRFGILAVLTKFSEVLVPICYMIHKSR